MTTQRADLVSGGFEVTVDTRFFEPLPADELAAWEGDTAVAH
jgi:hypothetical protein